MGANAVTTFPTYTTGQVLEAADLNITNCGVPTFADTTARDGAFGGTGEKTLAEGQLCYLEDSNIVQYYDGSSWATVGPAAPGALTLVKTQTIGSAVSTVTVTNAFSATYDAYKITVIGGAGSTTENIRMQLGASTASYYDGVLYIANTALTTPASAGTNNGSIFARVGSCDSDGIQINIDIIGPFLAKQTSFHGVYAYGPSAMGVAFGFHNVSTSYTDFTLSPGSGTLTGGEIRVYGYANS
ncbi:MAG: hypothetical protein ACO3IP_09325 [Burkholderiaceae bacterium]